jgi:hypothetical protein
MKVVAPVLLVLFSVCLVHGKDAADAVGSDKVRLMGDRWMRFEKIR